MLAVCWPPEQLWMSEMESPTRAHRGRIAAERIERAKDEVRMRLEQPRVRLGAADDHVDLLG